MVRGDGRRAFLVLGRGGKVQEIQPELHLGDRREGFVLQVGDGALEELAVKIETDGGDVTALFRAQHVARAADLQVPQRQFEAGAEAGVALDRADPLSRVVEKVPVPRQQQVGVGLVFVAADAAAKLVQVRHAEAVRAIDEDGVHVGDVHAALDDGGAEEHVEFPAHEGVHDVGQLPLVHLPVRDGDACLGHKLREPLADAVDARHPVVQVIHLSPAIELVQDRLPRDLLGVLDDQRFHRQAVLRRGLDGAHVLRAGQAHVERARDRRGGQRQHIHEFPHVLEVFLVRDAEALLFIHDDKPEIGEFHVRLQQAVGADHDVHAALGQPARDVGLLGAGAEAAEHFDGDGVGGHPLAECVVVLLGEDGRRDQHRDLPSVHDGLERGAHCDFRFAVAHVAADEAVHGPPALHVGLHIGDGAGLVGGFLVGERRFELVLPGRILRERVSVHRVAPRLGFEEAGGEILNGALGGDFLLVPPAAAERVQLRAVVPDAHVAAQQVRLRDGHIQLRFVRVLDRQHFLRLSIEFDLVQAQVFSNPVIHVNDELSGLDVGPVHESRAGRSVRARPFAVKLVAARLDLAEAVQVGLRHHDHVERGADEPFAQGGHVEMQEGWGAAGFREAIARTPCVEEDVNHVALPGVRHEPLHEFPAGGIEDVWLRDAAFKRRHPFHGMEVQLVGRG
ncbi:MAG: hypothetical protein BWY59_02298 [Verrucomicrobia bacterium ADurb.Bin345]|nr:MAG: hypothetical protein BWY59_02298 [Verrucomicrobia bacterium ADurb.Bin345]